MYHLQIAQLLKKYGRKYSKELQTEMTGLTDRAVSEKLVHMLSLPTTVSRFEEELMQKYHVIIQRSRILQGVERLLFHLHNHKVPAALATNSKKHIVDLHLQHRPQLFSVFHHMVCADDPGVERGKPHPDIYLTAASLFPDKPPPFQCLGFEDSFIGVKSAVDAGMQVVMIPQCDLQRRKAQNSATVILDSLSEFKPELFGLPPFTQSGTKSQRKNFK